MAQMRAERTGQGSRSESTQSDSCEAAWTGMKGPAAEEPRREPAENNEGKPAENSGGCTAAERVHQPPSFPDVVGDGASPHSNPEDGCKLGEPGESPALGRRTSSADLQLLKAEQREAESVRSSPAPRGGTKPAGKAEHAARRWAGVELNSVEGEPLSRMDSEDRLVQGLTHCGC